MGSATFALPSLNRLFEHGYDLAGVITQPDKPGGRGHALQAPPVKKRAFELHLPIYQPASLKTVETRALIEALEADMIVVVAYGKILPPWLLRLPRYGCINLHGSILPRYRGAAPVHWAVANGEQTTGVCTMLLDEGLDTGPVYLCRETHIGPDETAVQLYDRLAGMGADVLLETVSGIVNATLTPKPQDDSQATLAPALEKEHGYIDWRMPAGEIHNRVRAFNPWPGTVARFRGGICKILQTAEKFGDGRLIHPISSERHLESKLGELDVRPRIFQPGAILSSKHSLSVVCGDGAMLEILLIQPENRKPISGKDFANGARIQADEKFQSLMDN
jgi:methionyl-tRNA formyltransferase